MSRELQEALTAAGAPALNPKIIDPMMLEYQRRYSALTRAIPTKKWNADTYFFNQRSLNPAGGFVVDGGARPITNSTYEQRSFQMKHLQSVGAITGYAQAVTQDVIGDLRAREVEGAIRGLYWDIETAIVWGSAAATQYGPYPQFDGLDNQIAQYTGSNQNALAARNENNGGVISLGLLDRLADMVQTNAAMSVYDTSWMYVMSPTAKSRIGQLLVNQQRFINQVEIAAGLMVPTYKNIPLVDSSFLGTRQVQMGAVSTTPGTAGGSLAAGTYYYRVAAVIARQGEIAASPTVSAVTTGATGTVTLSFAQPAGVDGLAPILFKVYRGTASGQETLLGAVDASVGLAADQITPIAANTIVDDGQKLVPQYVLGQQTIAPAQTPPVYCGTNVNKYPQSVGCENLFLISRDQENVVRPYVRELTPLDVYPTTHSPDSIPYAVVTDTCLAVRAPKFLGGVYGVNTTLAAA